MWTVFGRKCGEQCTSYENAKMEGLRLDFTLARVDVNLSNRGEIWSRGSESTGVANSRYDSRKRHRVLIDSLISVKIVGSLRWYNSATNSVIDENCGSWWPKYCFGNIKFTLGITINVDTYLFYKRFLEYLSLHTCTRLRTFFHTRPFVDC